MIKKMLDWKTGKSDNADKTPCISLPVVNLERNKSGFSSGQ